MEPNAAVLARRQPEDSHRGAECSLLLSVNIPTLRRQQLAQYLRQRFGPAMKLLSFGPIGQETNNPALKGYGYGHRFG